MAGAGGYGKKFIGDGGESGNGNRPGIPFLIEELKASKVIGGPVKIDDGRSDDFHKLKPYKISDNSPQHRTDRSDKSIPEGFLREGNCEDDKKNIRRYGEKERLAKGKHKESPGSVRGFSKADNPIV